MAILMGMNITTVVQAQQRDAHELDSIANSVFTTGSRGTRAVTAPLKMSLKSSDVLAKGSLTNREAFYIYNSTGDAGRFVIVSGDQRMPAILGYSDKGILTPAARRFEMVPAKMKTKYAIIFC